MQRRDWTWSVRNYEFSDTGTAVSLHARRSLSPPPRIHTNRTAGGDSDYRHPGRPASARVEQIEDENAGDPMSEQSQTVAALLVDVSGRQRWAACAGLFTIIPRVIRTARMDSRSLTATPRFTNISTREPSRRPDGTSEQEFFNSTSLHRTIPILPGFRKEPAQESSREESSFTPTTAGRASDTGSLRKYAPR